MSAEAPSSELLKSTFFPPVATRHRFGGCERQFTTSTCVRRRRSNCGSHSAKARHAYLDESSKYDARAGCAVNAGRAVRPATEVNGNRCNSGITAFLLKMVVLVCTDLARVDACAAEMPEQQRWKEASLPEDGHDCPTACRFRTSRLRIRFSIWLSCC